jgi:hypothetical protein
MKQPVNLFKETVSPLIMEHLDAYVVLGYSADKHQRVVVANLGRDHSCRDGLMVMLSAAERWRRGELGATVGPQHKPGAGNTTEQGA